MRPAARHDTVPTTVRVVVGIVAGSALITFLTAFGTGTALLALPVLVVTGVLTALAVRLHLGGRVARALTPAVAATLLLSAIALGVSAWWIVVGLATTGASAVLLLAPSVRAFFAGPAGRVPRAGVSVTLVQVVAWVTGGFLALGTLASLVFGLAALASGSSVGSGGDALSGAVGGLIGMAGGIALASSLFYAALAAFWLWAAQALSRGNRGARIAVSVVCGLNALPSLLYLAYLPGLTLTAFLVLGAVAGALWLPADARRHFGEPPLPVVDRWHRSAVTLGETVAANAPTIGPLTTGGPGAAGFPAPPHAGHPARPAGPGTPGSGTPRPAPRWPHAPGPDSPASGIRTPGPGASPPGHAVPLPRNAPSGPMPVADLEEDPVTTPVRLGRHARREAGPVEPV